MECDRIVRLRAERTDSAGYLHEFVLITTPATHSGAGAIQRQRGRRRRTNRVDPASRHGEQQPELQRQRGLRRLDHSHRQLLQIKRPGAGHRSGPGACAGALARFALEPGEPLRRKQLFVRAVQLSRQEAHPHSRLCQIDQQYFQLHGSLRNQNNEFNALIQYQFRKLNFNSGYSRLEQGFSGSGTPPEVISSFYIGVSRWFNFF